MPQLPLKQPETRPLSSVVCVVVAAPLHAVYGVLAAKLDAALGERSSQVAPVSRVFQLQGHKQQQQQQVITLCVSAVWCARPVRSSRRRKWSERRDAIVSPGDGSPHLIRAHMTSQVHHPNLSPGNIMMLVLKRFPQILKFNDSSLLEEHKSAGNNCRSK